MYERIPQSVAKTIVVPAYLSSDHLSAATGKTTLQITISKNGAAFGNPGGGGPVCLTEIANGFYSYSLSSTDLGTLGPLAVFVSDTGSTTDPIRLIFEVVEPHNAGFSGVPAAASGAAGGLPLGDASGNVTLTTTQAAAITPPTAAAIAALIVSGSPITTDLHGYVTINNTNILTSDQITQLQAASQASQVVPPSATEIASAILSNTSMRLVVDSNGAVTANNADFLTSTEQTQLANAATT
jgi:hypothetical protein